MYIIVMVFFVFLFFFFVFVKVIELFVGFSCVMCFVMSKLCKLVVNSVAHGLLLESDSSLELRLNRVNPDLVLI